VGIATCYGLECQGFESRCGRDFSGPFQTGRGANSVSYKMSTCFFTRGKVAAQWRWPPHPI